MRYPEIDGIRGFAPLVVLLCHMMVTPFGHLLPTLNPGFLLINGTLAVQIFLFYPAMHSLQLFSRQATTAKQLT